MRITKSGQGGSLALVLEGRLDTRTAPLLEAELKDSLSGLTELVLDMAGVDYVSSAGLRVLLAAHKQMAKQGSLRLAHVNPGVMEVFDMTGFTDILRIDNGETGKGPA